MLVRIWERSVRASHDFLREEDIRKIRGRLESDYFPHVDLSCVEEEGCIAGFVGISGRTIEMLFIDASLRGRGVGTKLIRKAIEAGATRVDVNEQNPAALEFYKARGFRIVGRSDTDDAGRPYPILHLSL